jgi:hypothetical protein
MERTKKEKEGKARTKEENKRSRKEKTNEMK